MDKKTKKGYFIYTLSICYNEETEEIEYISEGIDANTDFTPIYPFDLDISVTDKISTEDMVAFREFYKLGDC